MHKQRAFFSCLLLAIVAVSCSPKNFSNNAAYQFKSADGKPDYKNLNYWAAHPAKWDPSDSVPKPNRKTKSNDETIDVFFVHPTTLTSSQDTNSNARIDDPAINSKTDYSAILYQASVFNGECRVFAPRYRQAHYNNYFTPDKARANQAFELAYQDVKEAFETYLKYYNNGRPIMIASHSQGTTHAARLLKEFFEGQTLSNKLVCAYLIGMPIPESYFNSLKPCKDSLTTGCIVSWRTYKKGFEGSEFVLNETFKAVVTNPLTWTTDTLFAPARLNTGAVLKNFNRLYPGLTDARIHKNILWSSKPRFFGNFLLRQENYHVGDINLFYNNIRQNVHTRKAMYWKN